MITDGADAGHGSVGGLAHRPRDSPGVQPEHKRREEEQEERRSEVKDRVRREGIRGQGKRTETQEGWVGDTVQSCTFAPLAPVLPLSLSFCNSREEGATHQQTQFGSEVSAAKQRLLSSA